MRTCAAIVARGGGTGRFVCSKDVLSSLGITCGALVRVHVEPMGCIPPWPGGSLICIAWGEPLRSSLVASVDPLVISKHYQGETITGDDFNAWRLGAAGLSSLVEVPVLVEPLSTVPRASRVGLRGVASVRFTKESVSLLRESIRSVLLHLAVGVGDGVALPSVTVAVEAIEPAGAGLVVITHNTQLSVEFDESAPNGHHGEHICGPNTPLDQTTEHKMARVGRKIGGYTAQVKDVLEVLAATSSTTAASVRTCPTGLLIHGPAGVGKSLLIATVCDASGAVTHSVDVGSLSGTQLEHAVSTLQDAFVFPAASSPCVLILDKLDAINSRNASDASLGTAAATTMAALLRTLLTLLDGFYSKSGVDGETVAAAVHRPLVIATARDANMLDPAFRRPGRLERELALDVPSSGEREMILGVLTRDMPLDDTVDLAGLAAACRGFVGSDIRRLCRDVLLRHAACIPAESSIDSAGASSVTISQADFLKTLGDTILLSHTHATHSKALHAPNATGRAMTWNDIGGMDRAKKRLKRIQIALHSPEVLLSMGITPPRGILLHGPPGCSKTSLVRAVAHDSNATLFHLTGAQIYSPYVGEAEKTVRAVFAQARTSVPAIVCFDEIDALVGQRGFSSGSRDGVAESVLSTLLNELDGIESAHGIVFLAATNRPDMLDAALLRPGRLDEAIYVELPGLEERLAILHIHTRDMPLCDDVDLRMIAQQTDGYTGAELESLCREAAMIVARKSSQQVTRADLETVIRHAHPSVTHDMLRVYEQFQQSQNRKP